MVSKIFSCGLQGIEGELIEVEVDSAFGIPKYDTVGLPDKAILESRERVISALRNCDRSLPPRKIIVNLAPAALKKVGTVYDLPIAIGVLQACGIIDVRKTELLEESIIFGELSLGGELRSVSGAISMALFAKKTGIKKLICPTMNAKEASCVKGVEVIGVKTLRELISILEGHSDVEIFHAPKWKTSDEDVAFDFKQIRGQFVARRAAEVAASGGHNMLLIGPPGGGKTMMAKAMMGILPKLSFDEAIEITRVHSAAGKRYEAGLVGSRPFISPHHSASSAALIGGGTNPKPGEISMAHLGMLFLDELPEFQREVLESLRQPLEDGTVTISRVQASATYPARFMLIGAMNPCPCGYFGSKKHRCSCSTLRIIKYKDRISGPLLDRMDIFVSMEELSYADLHEENASNIESTSQIKNRVDEARKIQEYRYKDEGIFSNGQMSQREIEKFCILDETAQMLLKREFDKRGFSGRANARILKLARTVADLNSNEKIMVENIAEAMQYRQMDRYWG